MHEQFQELCAVASIGQASAEELLLLEEHLLKCQACSRAYSEFTDIAAQDHASNFAETSVSPAELEQFPSSDDLEERFLKRVADEGAFSFKNEPSVRRSPSSIRRASVGLEGNRALTWKHCFGAMAVLSVAALAVVFAYKLGRATSDVNSFSPKLSTASLPSNAARSPQVAELTAALQQQISRLQSSLAIAQAQSKERQAVADSLSQEKADLSSKQDDEERVIRQLQQQLTDTQATLVSAREEMAKIQSGADDERASFIASQVKVRDLSDQLTEKLTELKRDQLLLGRDRDIRDLMVARNLHIYDVFDTDSKGKTGAAFGRIFYTEGKSLVFYAYDLNEVGVQKADYHYRVWGAKDGHDDKALSLGIFYSDDKSQRRWVFRCDDPKILKQIDSVFVTLESSSDDVSHPKGQKLLDAYLRGLPNHP